MKLIDFITYLKGHSVPLKEIDELDIDSTIIYMKDVLDIDSELFFFDEDETKDDQLFENDGTRFIQLFPLDYAKDFIKELKTCGHGDLVIAERMVAYRTTDS